MTLSLTAYPMLVSSGVTSVTLPSRCQQRILVFNPPSAGSAAIKVIGRRNVLVAILNPGEEALFEQRRIWRKPWVYRWRLTRRRYV